MKISPYESVPPSALISASRNYFAADKTEGRANHLETLHRSSKNLRQNLFRRDQNSRTHSGFDQRVFPVIPGSTSKLCLLPVWPFIGMKSLLFSLLVATLSVVWSEESKPSTFDSEVAESERIAIEYYPDLLDPASPLKRKYFQLKAKLEFYEDPVTKSSNHPFLIATKAALELGIAAKKLPTVAEVKPEFVTATGKIYKLVTITKITPDGISLMHEKGATKVPYNDLTQVQRDEFGLTDERLAAYLAERQKPQPTAQKPLQPPSRPKAEVPKSPNPPKREEPAIPASRFGETKWTAGRGSSYSIYYFKKDGTFLVHWKGETTSGTWQSMTGTDLTIFRNGGEWFKFSLNPDGESITRSDGHIWRKTRTGK